MTNLNTTPHSLANTIPPSQREARAVAQFESTVRASGEELARRRHLHVRLCETDPEYRARVAQRAAGAQ